MAVVALAGVAAFVAAIRAELVTRGLVEVRTPEPVPSPSETSSSELATLLAPLVEALREDLSHRPGRQNGSGPLVGTEENR